MVSASVILSVVLALFPQDVPQDYARVKSAFDEAPDPLARMLELRRTEPDNPWVWHFLGRSHQERREFKLAASAFRGARERDSKNAWHEVTLGQLAVMSADIPGAAHCYGRAASKEDRPRERAEWKRRNQYFLELADEGQASERRLRAIFWGILVLLIAGVAWFSR